eukprot:gene18933-biopygen5458
MGKPCPIFPSRSRIPEPPRSSRELRRRLLFMRTECLPAVQMSFLPPVPPSRESTAGYAAGYAQRQRCGRRVLPAHLRIPQQSPQRHQSSQEQPQSSQEAATAAARWARPGRNGRGRALDASRTIEFEETAASRTQPQPFLPSWRSPPSSPRRRRASQITDPIRSSAELPRTAGRGPFAVLGNESMHSGHLISLDTLGGAI